LRADLAGTVIGVEKDFYFGDADSDVAGLVLGAVERLSEFGAVVRPVSVDGLRDAVWALTVIDTAETTAVHRDNLRARPSDYGPDVRFLLECGALVSAVDYLTAQQVRERLRGVVGDVFRQVDALVAPTLPLRTPEIGARVALVNGVEVDVPANRGRLVGPANLLGLPSLTVPCGVLDAMPVGMELIGRPLGEQEILNIGLAVEASEPLAVGPDRAV
jgi:aspartyl-tRNA(Asn)/glutamyl-tRNA(Gln) amidotransferase subunit A